MDVQTSVARHELMRIAGEKVDSDRLIEINYPYTGQLIATVPSASVLQVRQAITTGYNHERRLTRHERYVILMGAREEILRRKEELAEVITLESGLCLQDTLGEVSRTADVLLFAANQSLVDDGSVFSCDITSQGQSRRIYTQRDRLLGVICAITPFNHPLNQIAHKVAPAIATNNRIIVKPSEKTPVSALLFADILYAAGLPGPMLSVVTGDVAEIGDELISNEQVDLVSFTGSVRTGKDIAAKAGYKKVVLELGGNDPLIVLEDADIEEAVQIAVKGSYKNSGQRCTAVKRMLVHHTVADRFAALLVEKTSQFKWGDPLDPATEMGPVIDEAAATQIESRVTSALAAGAKLLHGHTRKKALYSPTVLDNVTPEMQLVREETFGPVSPIIRFRTLDEAIAIANGTKYGLSSAVCTNNFKHITRLVTELNVGTVNVREVPGYRLELTPFGGVKDSGTGFKEGILESMKMLTTIKTYSLPW